MTKKQLQELVAKNLRQHPNPMIDAGGGAGGRRHCGKQRRGKQMPIKDDATLALWSLE